MLHDPLIDWLNMFGAKHGFKKDSNDFKRSLFEDGINYENEVISDLCKRFSTDHVECMRQMPFEKRVEKTFAAISRNVPIIYQGGVTNTKNQSFGIPDLIIRGDYLEMVFKTDITKRLCIVSNKYYIVDIKHSTIKLNKDYTISNAMRTLPFKGQIIVYHEALEDMIGSKYAGNISFVWAKNTVGCIDPSGVDAPLVSVVHEAIKWYSELLTNGESWDPYVPMRLEMCPNMNNNDREWDTAKHILALHHGELTLLWNVTIQERNQLWNAGVKSWRSRRFKTSLLEGKNTEYQRIMEECLEVNRTDIHRVLPYYIHIDKHSCLKEFPDWQNKREVLELYIDFETTDDAIFMIGCVCRGVYEAFTGNERECVVAFLKFIESTGETDVRLIHWGAAEWTQFNKAIERHGEDQSVIEVLSDAPTLEWVDLHSHFLEIPIVVHGAFNFGLKSIAKALYNIGCIATTWTDDIDGFTVGQMAREMTAEKMKQITEYNRIDCMVMWEIVVYLRANMRQSYC